LKKGNGINIERGPPISEGMKMGGEFISIVIGLIDFD